MVEAMTTATAPIQADIPDYLDWSYILWDYPVDFVRECFGVEPEPFQAEFMKLLPRQDITQIAVKACHGPGKTAELAWACLWWLLAHPYSRVGATAPTQHQLHDVLWPEINTWIEVSKWDLGSIIEWKKTRVEVREAPARWFATQIVGKLIRSSSDIQEAPSLQGLHAEAVAWLVDEASGVPAAVFGAIKGSMSMAKYRKTIAVGNPNTPQGPWYQAFHKHRKYWWIQTIKYTDIVRNAEAVRAWGDELIEQYGPDHPWVRVKVFGEFPHQSEFGLIPLWAWERASAKDKREEILSSQQYSGRTIGVDVADTGANKTMIACAEGSVVVDLEEVKKPSIEELTEDTMTDLIANAVMDKIASFRATTVVIDADGGYGTGLVTILRNRFSAQKRYDVRIIEWHGGGAASEERFANARMELSWMMKDAIEAGKIAVPDNEDAAIQAVTLRFKYQKEGGRMVMWSKKELKDQLGLASPDEWDAITYSLVPALMGNVYIPESNKDKQSRMPGRQRVTASGFC